MGGNLGKSRPFLPEFQRGAPIDFVKDFVKLCFVSVSNFDDDGGYALVRLSQ